MPGKATNIVTITLKKQEYKKQALEDAKRLDLVVSEAMLHYFINAVQQSRSVTIRKVSKSEAILLIYVNGVRYYVRYNNRYKLIVGFHSEEEARFHRYDQVNVIIDPHTEQYMKGQIVFVLKSFADPRQFLKFFSRLDVSNITSSSEKCRSQYSYLVRIPTEGGADKIIWPPTRNLRKLLNSDTNHNGNSSK